MVNELNPPQQLDLLPQTEENDIIQPITDQQRKWMIDTLTEIKNALVRENECGGICDTLWMDSGTETVFDYIDRSIEHASTQWVHVVTK